MGEKYLAKFQICWKTPHLKFISRAVDVLSPRYHAVVQKAKTMSAPRRAWEKGELRETRLDVVELQGAMDNRLVRNRFFHTHGYILPISPYFVLQPHLKKKKTMKQPTDELKLRHLF